MSLQTKFNKLKQEIIAALCNIEEFPDKLLPHTVFVEEACGISEWDGATGFYTYSLIKVFPDGYCILENAGTGKEEKRHLSEINIDWLLTVWDYYKDLSGKKEPEPVVRKLYAFLYPSDTFRRNVSDDEILSAWKNDEDVKKLTLDEFAERINGEMFNDLEYWVRFIEVED